MMMVDTQKLKWIGKFAFNLAALIFATGVLFFGFGITVLGFSRLFGHSWRFLIEKVATGGMLLSNFIEVGEGFFHTNLIFLFIFSLIGFVIWIISGLIIGWFIFKIKDKVPMKIRGIIIGVLIPLFWLIAVFIIEFITLIKNLSRGVNYPMGIFYYWKEYFFILLPFFIAYLIIGLILGFLIGLYIERRLKKKQEMGVANE